MNDAFAMVSKIVSTARMRKSAHRAMENARGSARTRNSALELNSAVTAGRIVMMALMNVIVLTHAAINSVLVESFSLN